MGLTEVMLKRGDLVRRFSLCYAVVGVFKLEKKRKKLSETVLFPLEAQERRKLGVLKRKVLTNSSFSCLF